MKKLKEFRLSLKNNSKRRLRFKAGAVAIYVAVFLLVVSGTTTYSWFFTFENFTNRFRSQQIGYAFALREQFEEPESIENGETIEKIVHAANIGEIAGLVRILVVPEMMSEHGLLLPATLGETFFVDMNLRDFSDPSCTNMWAWGGGFHYYYLGVVHPCSAQTCANCPSITSQPLFRNVTLANNLGSEYENASFRIDVVMESAHESNYRVSWWGTASNETPPVGSDLISIDNALQSALS